MFGEIDRNENSFKGEIIFLRHRGSGFLARGRQVCSRIRKNVLRHNRSEGESKSFLSESTHLACMTHKIREGKRVGVSRRKLVDMRPPRALPAAHFQRNPPGRGQ